MQLSHSLPLHIFRDNLKAVCGSLKPYANLEIYCGHRKQSPHLLTAEYPGDVLETAELILGGKKKGDPQSIHSGNYHMDYLVAKHKSMLGFCYNPEKL
jgi:hypothetical protein